MFSNEKAPSKHNWNENLKSIRAEWCRHNNSELWQQGSFMSCACTQWWGLIVAYHVQTVLDITLTVYVSVTKTDSSSVKDNKTGNVEKIAAAEETWPPNSMVHFGCCLCGNLSVFVTVCVLTVKVYGALKCLESKRFLHYLHKCCTICVTAHIPVWTRQWHTLIQSTKEVYPEVTKCIKKCE